jgi:hypothetical protein
LCSQDWLCAVGLHFPLPVELCIDLEVGVWLSQCLLSLVCLASLSVSSCVDLPRLYDTLVSCYLILVGHDIGIVAKNTFVVTAGKLPGIF